MAKFLPSIIVKRKDDDAAVAYFNALVLQAAVPPRDNTWQEELMNSSQLKLHHNVFATNVKVK